MNNVIPLQNSPERVSLLPIAPGVDFATALSLRRMATSTGATPAYLLAPEVSALLFYMPDQRHHMLFATLWNTGMRIGEARMLTPESFDLDGVRPFVRILSEKVRARRGRPRSAPGVYRPDGADAAADRAVPAAGGLAKPHGARRRRAAQPPEGRLRRRCFPRLFRLRRAAPDFCRTVAASGKF